MTQPRRTRGLRALASGLVRHVVVQGTDMFGRVASVLRQASRSWVASAWAATVSFSAIAPAAAAPGATAGDARRILAGAAILVGAAGLSVVACHEKGSRMLSVNPSELEVCCIDI